MQQPCLAMLCTARAVTVELVCVGLCFRSGVIERVRQHGTVQTVSCEVDTTRFLRQCSSSCQLHEVSCIQNANPAIRLANSVNVMAM